MPVVFRWTATVSTFIRTKETPREPVHVHVTTGRPTAKFWLYPDVTVAYNKGFSSRVQTELARVIEERKQEIDEAWNEHFS